MDIEQIKRVKAAAEQELLDRPGVVGVSVGYKYVGGKKTDQLAIRVLVEEKKDVPPDQEIPPTIDSVPTDVIQRRFVPRPLVVPLTDVTPTADPGKYDPLQGGISVGPCRDVAGGAVTGTLGLPVEDRSTGAPMLLSNFHVLAVDDDHTVGDTVVQPAIGDGGRCPADVIAVLERAELGGRLDAAVARITAREDECAVVDVGSIRGTATPQLDMGVRKRGRTTGLTDGVIEAVDLTVTVSYEGIGDITLTDQLEIRAGGTAFSVEPGLFIFVPWTTLPTTTAGDVTVTRSVGGSNPGISVAAPGGSVFHPTLGSNVSRYMVFGSPPSVLILESTTSAGPVTHRVTAVNLGLSPPQEKLVLTGTASGSSVPPPVVQHSQGSGSAFLIFNSSGTEIHNLAIFRSRDGQLLCPGPPPFVPTGETRGEATETELIIHFSSGGTSTQTSCPLGPGGGSDTFGLGGDSGAVVVNEDDRVVGLFFASSVAVTDEEGNVLEPEGAVGNANPIDAVLSELGVRLCESSGGGGAGGVGGGGSSVPREFSVRDLALRCLDTAPPISLRRDVFEDDVSSSLRLRQRLVAIHRAC